MSVEKLSAELDAELDAIALERERLTERQVAAVEVFNNGVAVLAAALGDSDGQKRKKVK